jgi:hypothetical protein
MDNTAEAVDDLISKYDTDGDGMISFDEFKAIYAQSPLGLFDWYACRFLYYYYF